MFLNFNNNLICPKCHTNNLTLQARGDDITIIKYKDIYKCEECSSYYSLNGIIVLLEFMLFFLPLTYSGVLFYNHLQNWLLNIFLAKLVIFFLSILLMFFSLITIKKLIQINLKSHTPQ